MPNKGTEFRDAVATLLRAGGYSNVTTEVTIAGKNVDIYAEKHTGFGVDRLAFEAKDFRSNLPNSEAIEFCNHYSWLRNNGHVERAILVSRNELTPQAKSAVSAARSSGLVAQTFDEFQRAIFGPAQYLSSIKNEYENSLLSEYYIPARTKDGQLDKFVDDWMVSDSPAPLIVLGGYGTGKSTFALHLTARMAEEAMRNPRARIPIRVKLGDLVHENTLPGLFGRLFTDTYRVENYSWSAFCALNRLGRFVIIYDGFDEMKHGMTFEMFQRQFDQLLTLSEGDSRIVVLGRDSAMPTDVEFKAIIEGRVADSGGGYFPSGARPKCSYVRLEPFDLAEARRFVTAYLPIQIRKEMIENEEFIIDSRVNTILSGTYDEIIVRPVHGQMLCMIASDSGENIENMDEFKLYDRFVHLLLIREVRKDGRYAAFDVSVRRRANAALSWWMLSRSGASTTSLSDAPIALFKQVVSDIHHHFDDHGLKRELCAGCLVDKGPDTIYFGHRSIQEFLAAEHLLLSDGKPFQDGMYKPTRLVVETVTSEMMEFFSKFASRRSDGFVHIKNILDDFLTEKSVINYDRLFLPRISYAAIKDVVNPDVFGARGIFLEASFFQEPMSSRFRDQESKNACLALLEQSLRTEALSGAEGEIDEPTERFLGAILFSCTSLDNASLAKIDLPARLIEPASLRSMLKSLRESSQRVFARRMNLRTFLLLSSMDKYAASKRIIKVDGDRLCNVVSTLLGFDVRLDSKGVESYPNASMSTRNVCAALGLNTAHAENLARELDVADWTRLLPEPLEKRIRKEPSK